MNIVKFKTTDACLYEQYLKLKYEVFCAELGIVLAVDVNNGICLQDAHDASSFFCGALLKGELIGVVRCSVAEGDYPYRLFFNSYINDSHVQPSKFAVLTSLAFLKKCRGSGLREGGSYAYKLFSYLVKDLSSLGFSQLILTAMVSRSEKVFIRWGFEPISNIYKMNNFTFLVKNYTYYLQG